jgi:hypothetical protein
MPNHQPIARCQRKVGSALRLQLNRELMRRLSLFGADPRATDASRLLRVTGTLHSGAGRAVEVLHLEECKGRTITYDPHWLCEQLAPGADQMAEQVPIPAPASDGSRVG